MTPLASYTTAVTPTAGVINSIWCAIVVPELTTYLPTNGSTVVTSGAVPIPGPLFRMMTEWQFRLETGTGVSAGTIEAYELCLDGNWHPASGTQVLAASTTYATGVGPGTSAQVTGGGKISFPTNLALGVGIVLTAALVGGNINFIELKGVTSMIDPEMGRVINPLRI